MSVIVCPHRPACPGCDLAELTPEGALVQKRDTVADAIGRHSTAGPAATVSDCVGTEDRYGYRTRVKWAVDGAAIGLYTADHDVVDTPLCAVTPAPLLALVEPLRHRPLAAETDAQLGGVDARLTERGEMSLVLIMRTVDRRAAETLARSLLALIPEPVGVAWSVRHPGSPSLLGDAPITVRGVTTLRDRIGRTEALFPAGSFSQVHRGQTAWLHDQLRAAVPPGSHVVDLYAGTGSLGLAVVSKAASLTLVEPFAPAADAARQVAPPAVRVICGSAEVPDSWLGPRPRVLIVDPPRTGLTGDALSAIARACPDRVILISCEPETLARDLAGLAWQGLRTSRVQPFDMMPGTSQVESFAVLDPGDPPPLQVLGRTSNAVAVAKPPWVPTIPNPEWPWNLLDLARRQLGGALQAAHRLDVTTSGVVLLSPEGSRVLTAPGHPNGLEKCYLTLVRGVARKRGAWRMPLNEDGRNVHATTHYERLDVVGGHSLLRVTLETGRTHQIRRHAAMNGHPVLGDARYGDPKSNRHFFARYGLQRPFLHAESLEVGTERYECELWPDLQAVLDVLSSD
ncbi:MAG: hypothetical protein IV100_14075 [Myxococcales bacterium]|nr:hypothetical protein [Myxococcales bacterium]